MAGDRPALQAAARQVDGIGFALLEGMPDAPGSGPIESASQRLPAEQGGCVVFYDGRCGLCRWSRRMVERQESGVPIRWVDVNDRQELARWPQVNPEATRQEVFVLDREGRLHGGYEAAVALLAATTPAVRVMRPVLLWGPMRFVGGKAYHWVSQNRDWLSRRLALE